jgi:Icc-related predicted phosphoesterase
MNRLSICCISDTHSKHNQLDLSKYPADVLVHAGDWTGGRDEDFSETEEFFKWLSAQPYSRKLFIAGNHERTVENNEKLFYDLLKHYPTIEYIHHKAVTISGVKFYGSNYSNEFCGWAFMEEDLELSKIWDKIPDDTDVLITHGPAYAHKDLVQEAHDRNPHVGSQALTRRKLDIPSLKLHVNGHIHCDYGKLELSSHTVINAAMLNTNYKLVNDPIVTTITKEI